MIRHRGDGTLVALAVVALWTLLTPCLAVALAARDANNTLPAAVSVAPDQNWEGIDGKWNTVSIRVGEPAQLIRVFVSTASQQTWVVHASACMENTTDEATGQLVEQEDRDCFESRGRTFNLSESTSWDENGFFQLWTEKNLGLIGNGFYGWDKVGLGLKGEEGPTLDNTTVGTLISPNFWLGHFGVNPKPTNFSAFVEPSPSYMTLLYEGGQLPSLAFGYTAGKRYHDPPLLSSLTLGGYDTTRLIPNDISFGFAPDNERDIVVGILGITASSATKSNINLRPRDPFTMYIDSTIAELWMPIEVCKAFEQTFGLTFDNNTSLYLVNDDLHQRLLAENPSITFSLGQPYASDATVNITLPYDAFDLEASPPYRGLENSTRYFPIRQAAEEGQFVLGKVFLQEAYLIVDWERQNFSVSATNWTYGVDEDIVPIYAQKYMPQVLAANAKPKHFTTGSIIGIALGAGFGFAIVVSGVIWWFWRRRQKRKLEEVKAMYEQRVAAAVTKEPLGEKSDLPPVSPTTDAEEGTNVFPKAELPAEDRKDGELSSPLSGPLVEAADTPRQIFEMPGCTPTSAEAGGRQLTEKESMMVRERIYNGVDPNEANQDTSPRSEEPPRRPAPVSPSEVTMVSRRIPNVSPITPRAPRDGASLEANDTFFQPPTPRVRDGASLEANDTFFSPLQSRTPRDGRFLEAEDTLLSPISPMEGSEDSSRRRFSYEI
ncbi:acid protease [Lentithecium fluviatile CBS 122367]|uniref:Acid protease n=1 Tax=Lentithecium fluviatile CBS 122367 TaxID=1168545 RepID=A0A6G1IY87_9PLEO|nr:acid protease [Lentithecium fluviatile CBS 122367]